MTLFQVYFNQVDNVMSRKELLDTLKSYPSVTLLTKCLWKTAYLWTVFCSGKHRTESMWETLCTCWAVIELICPGILDAFKKMSLKKCQQLKHSVLKLTPQHFL